MIKDDLKVTGNVSIVVKDSKGNIKDQREIKNLVVGSGKDFIASRMAGVTDGVMSHMALGADTTAAAAGNTTLGSELGRVALDSTTVSGSSVTYVATFPAGTATGAATEAGIFNDPASGVMLCRTVFAVVNKGADDLMSITWEVTVS